MEITTRSGKILPGHSVGKFVNGEMVVDKSEESKPVEYKELGSSVDASEKEK